MMTKNTHRNNRRRHSPSKKNDSSARPSDSKNPKNNRLNQRNRRPKKHSKWGRYRVSEHFMKRDFDSRQKDCACKSSLRISLGLVGIIEALRAKINQRINIVTGYYCPECRPKQYGVKRDFHHQGVAADITVDDMDIRTLFLEAEGFPEIKGLGINFDTKHVHIDTRKEDERESWVEINQEWILLTDENRAEYFPPTPPPTDS